MLKLKISLNPNDAKQMLALSRFAGTLADVTEVTTTADPAPAIEEVKPEAAVVPLHKGRTAQDQASEEANGNTEPANVEATEAPKRKRRSKAEIEADEAAEAAAKAEKPKQEGDGEEAESEEAEVEEEDETEDEAPAPKSEKPAGPTKRGSITLDDVRRAVAEKKGTAENFQKMKDTLKAKYGVETTPKLDPKYYAEFYDFVNGLK